MSDFPSSGRFSASAYFACLLGLTFLGLGLAMVFRPAFAASVKSLLGLEAARPVAMDSFYAKRVEPLLQQHCVGCHGERVAKGQLRLDSLTAVYRGAKHGPVIEPGNPHESELVRRISLSPSDDRAMPPSGKPPLEKDAITVIRLWVAAGASGELPANAIKNAPKLVPPVHIPEFDPHAVDRLRAPMSRQMDALRKRYPDIVDYESRDSADVAINASLMGMSFEDADFSALAPLKEHIVSLDLSRTAVSDAIAPLLAAMPRLRIVRLAETKITDVTIQALAGVKSLRALTITGNAGTGNAGAALAPLRQRGVRIHGGNDGT